MKHLRLIFRKRQALFRQYLQQPLQLFAKAGSLWSKTAPLLSQNTAFPNGAAVLLSSYYYRCLLTATAAAATAAAAAAAAHSANTPAVCYE